MAKKTKDLDRSKLGNRNRKKGARYELKIIKELNNIYNTTSLVSTRSESKRLDNLGVDIADKDNILPFYVQCKNTKATPNVALLSEFKLNDKPLALFWNKQVQKAEKSMSAGEYIIIKKEFFYNLIQNEKH